MAIMIPEHKPAECVITVARHVSAQQAVLHAIVPRTIELGQQEGIVLACRPTTTTKQTECVYLATTLAKHALIQVKPHASLARLAHKERSLRGPVAAISIISMTLPIQHAVHAFIHVPLVQIVLIVPAAAPPIIDISQRRPCPAFARMGIIILVRKEPAISAFHPVSLAPLGPHAHLVTQRTTERLGQTIFAVVSMDTTTQTYPYAPLANTLARLAQLAPVA